MATDTKDGFMTNFEFEAALASAEAARQAWEDSIALVRGHLTQAMQTLIKPGMVISRKRKGNPRWLMSVATVGGHDRGTDTFEVVSDVGVEVNPHHIELSRWSCEAIPISEKTGVKMSGAVHGINATRQTVRLVGYISVAPHGCDELAAFKEVVALLVLDRGPRRLQERGIMCSIHHQGINMIELDTQLEQKLFAVLKEVEAAQKAEEDYRWDHIGSYPNVKIPDDVREKWQEDLKIISVRQLTARDAMAAIIKRSDMIKLTTQLELELLGVLKNVEVSQSARELIGSYPNVEMTDDARQKWMEDLKIISVRQLTARDAMVAIIKRVEG